MMTYDLCEDNLHNTHGKDETVLSLMIRPFEDKNTSQNRICGLFAMVDQLFSEQHNPRSVMVSRCLKMIDRLLQKSQGMKVMIIPPKPLTIQAFVKGMLKRAETVLKNSDRQQPTLYHAAETFHEAFSSLYCQVDEKLSQFFIGSNDVNIQQMVAHHSGLAQGFHSFRSSLFSFCRLFFQDQLYKLMHVPASEIEEKLEGIYSSLLDDRPTRLAVI